MTAADDSDQEVLSQPLDPSDFIAVGEAPIREAKRLQAVLQGRGVTVRLASDPDNCTSCSPKIAMSIRAKDLEVFQALLREEHLHSLGDLQHDEKLSEAVFDSEKEQATCPACGTAFSTKLTECPDCGLGFGPI